MRCPFRINTREHRMGDYTNVVQNFAECHREECPFYFHDSNLNLEFCDRATETYMKMLSCEKYDKFLDDPMREIILEGENND